MKTNNFAIRMGLLALLIALWIPERVPAQEPAPSAQDLENVFPKKPPYSPAVDHRFPERVYWGDTTCTRRFLWTPVPPVAAWARVEPIVSRRGSKSPPPAASK